VISGYKKMMDDPCSDDPNLRLVYNSENVDKLCCPCCGDETGLHQFTTTTFMRAREDDQKTTKVTALNGNRDLSDESLITVQTTILNSDDSLNPSDRRDGLIIKFWCENCPTIHELAIYQHKGATLIGWKK
jgi:hypothetical protein